MAQSLLLLKRHGRTALFLFAAGLMLPGCGGNTPESAGEMLAARKCEFDDKQDELEYKLKTTLVAEIKGQKITNLKQLNQRERELRKTIHASDSTYKAEGKPMLNQLELDFPREDDRRTIANAVEARIKQCVQEREERNKSREKINIYDFSRKFYENN